VTTGRLLLQGKRLVDLVAAHRVPRALTARYTTANAGESERMVPLLDAQGIDPLSPGSRQRTRIALTGGNSASTR